VIDLIVLVPISTTSARDDVPTLLMAQSMSHLQQRCRVSCSFLVSFSDSQKKQKRMI